MEKDKYIIKKILKNQSDIENIHELKHPVYSTIKIFKLKNSNKKYILKSYKDIKHTDKETKNLDNINSAQSFNKPLYFGRYKNHFILEYIEGDLFQNLIENKNKKLDDYYFKCLESLSKIHSSKNFLKDKRKLNKQFEENSLEKRLNSALFFIKKVGIPSYKNVDNIPIPKWEKVLNKIDVKDITESLSIKEYYILGHGDYKPNNIIIKNDEVFIIDWFGMSKATPWYDLAYLLIHLSKREKNKFLKYYINLMHDKNLLLDTSYEKSKKLFRNGIILQQIIRSKSNSDKIKSKNNTHHINEFKKAMEGLLEVV